MMTAELAKELYLNHVQANPSEWTKLVMPLIEVAASNGEPECLAKLRVTGRSLPELATMVYELRALGYRVKHKYLDLGANESADVTVTISWSGVDDGRE